MIDVSVIIPVYNTEKYLEQCLRSVCDQTLKNIEIILVDDGSTDSSPEILRRFAAEDARITVITQQNINAGAARNRGLAMAKGKYLSFLDADDFFDPQMLEKAFRQAEADRAEITVFRSFCYDECTKNIFPSASGLVERLLPEHRPFAGRDVPRDLFGMVVGWAWDKLFLKSFVDENNLKFQEQRTTNDLYFVYAAMARADRITTVFDRLAYQRHNVPTSLSKNREKSWDCGYNALCALKKQLKEWDIYSRFEQDFVNYVMHYFCWYLEDIAEPTRKKVYLKLKKEWLRDLGVTGYPGKKFYHPGEYREYLKIRYVPYDGFARRVMARAWHAARKLIKK